MFPEASRDGDYEEVDLAMIPKCTAAESFSYPIPRLFQRCRPLPKHCTEVKSYLTIAAERPRGR